MAPVISAPPRLSCVRCNKNHDTPAAFLMACCKCERAWHHTCHIPPVTEMEIMGRIDADENGKRDAGLSAWQCRRCTKKTRVEAPAPIPTQVSGSAQKNIAPRGPTGRGGDRKGYAAPVARSPSVPVVPSSRSDSASTQAPIRTQCPVIEIDDDIEMVDAVPPPVPMKQPKPSIANVPTSIPARQDPRKIPSSGTSSVLAPAEPANSVNNTNTIPSSSAASHRGQKRKAKDAFVITPLPRPQVAAKQTQSRPSRQRSPAGRDTPASVDAPRPIEMEQRQPSPARASPPRRLPLPSPSSVDINDIRTLISNMRAGGQLKPPPSVDYVLRRPSTSQKCPTPQAQLKAPVERRSQTRDLEEVERKLDDFSMDVDLPEPVLPRDPEPNLELEPVPDPHNIDDLYGDVAPQYRNEPAPPRAKSTAPAQERLLFTLQKKRISEKDHSPLGAAIPGLQSDRARKPRKGPARQLKGKALQKRQADGLFFHVEEVDWGESGD